MSRSRLVVTTATMAAVAVALRALTPELSWLTAGDLDLQRVVDTTGPETLLLAAVAVGAWLAWAWGALGLALTALSGLPGLAGAVAGAVLRVVLPAAGRRTAALALGVGLAAPALTACTAPPVPTAVVLAAGESAAVPDWPAASPPGPATAPNATPAAVPDRPLPAPGEHVVLRGECLWSIAEADLRSRTGQAPADADVAAAVDRWWTANAHTIGGDPDVLLPGQVLRPPG